MGGGAPAHRLPEALRAVAPDAAVQAGQERARVEGACRSLRRAADEPGDAARRMRSDPSSHDYHFNAFLAQAFPRGSRSRRGEPCRPARSCRWRTCARSPSTTTRRPRSTMRSRCASCRTGTTRSGSTSPRPRSRSRAVPRSTRIARARLSTVYMPGRKITMLPEAAVEAFTLAEGRRRRRCRCTPKSRTTARWSGTGRASIASRSPRTCGSMPSARRSPTTFPHRPIHRGRGELRVLWKLAQALSAARGKPDFARIDYSFYVDWDAAPDGRVSIVPRPRGSPLDKLVSELMIFVNSTWGKLLADARVAGPLPHAGERQGEDEHAPGRAPGARARALPVVELAAAPLQRPRQPAPAAGGDRRREAAVRGERRRALRRAHRFRGDVLELRRVPGPDGALLVPALAAAGARGGNARHRDPREPGPLRPPAARRAPARPAAARARHAGARRHRAHRPARRHARMPLRRRSLGAARSPARDLDPADLAGCDRLSVSRAAHTCSADPTRPGRARSRRRPRERRRRCCARAGRSCTRCADRLNLPDLRAARRHAAARSSTRSAHRSRSTRRCSRSASSHSTSQAHARPRAAAGGRAGQRQDEVEADEGRHPGAGQPRRRRQHRRERRAKTPLPVLPKDGTSGELTVATQKIQPLEPRPRSS